jgi:hypothetical protein
MNAQPVTTPYAYPLVPGTPQWKALKNQQEKLDACQIPQHTLSNMTTDALVTTCLSYPLFGITLAAHEGGQKGLDALLKEFNGLRELIKRKDAGSFLIMRYRDFNPIGYDTTWPPIKQGEYSVKLYCLEMLISQDSIISNMSTQERKDLLYLTVDKYKLKTQRPAYGGFDFSTSAFLAGRIMIKEGYEEIIGSDSMPIHLTDHVKRGKPMNKLIVLSILQHAQQLINSDK